jgi:hypothetical protein
MSLRRCFFNSFTQTVNDESVHRSVSKGGYEKEEQTVRQKRLACFQEIGNKRYDYEMFVDLAIYDVPASLLKELGEKIGAR